MKLVVLYEELAAYFIACVTEYSKTTGSPVLIIAKQPNKVAPFCFDLHDDLQICFREELSEDQLQAKIDDFQPEAIFSGGWGYAPFRKVCKQYKKRIPVLIGFDNWWTGDVKQQLLSLGSPFTIQRYYNCCFVPGEPQKTFAKKLGFSEELIHTGAYCCDSNLYLKISSSLESKRNSFPKRFLFVGRYEKVKGIDHLWDAFLAFKKDHPEWELWCAGKGSITPREAEGIKHFGFVQPKELEELIAQTGIFVLPSTFEPWGVVIHEMAIAGMPQISTPEVGAAARFIQEGENGFIVPSGSTESIKNAMYQFAEMSVEAQFEMGAKSKTIGTSYTTKHWAENLLGLFQKTRDKLRG